MFIQLWNTHSSHDTQFVSLGKQETCVTIENPAICYNTCVTKPETWQSKLIYFLESMIYNNFKDRPVIEPLK